MDTKDIKITFKQWDYNCSDGCCYDYGVKLYVNDVEVEHPDEEQHDNSYLGDDPRNGIHAVLKHLGYNVTIEDI